MKLCEQQRRTEILEAAKEIFSVSGFHKADMNEIAKAANIAKGTVYLYFQSKKDLFIAVIKNGLENLAQKIRNEVKEIEEPVEKIKRAISTYMFFFRENQLLYRILLHPDLELMDDITETMKDVKLSKLPQLADTIIRGIEEGKIRPIDADALSYMILGMVDFSLFQWLSSTNAEPIEKKIEQVNEVLFKGILSG